MDKYHIYEEIGKGEFSQVFKGREKKKIEYVAIKRIEKSVMSKIVNEVQIMHKLHSAHTLKFHDWYETRNNLWLILEYCTGADLESLLKQDGYLPETSVRLFGLDVVAALKYLHGLGILHCDIRPCNFLIDEYGILKLCDFKFAHKIPKDAPLEDTPMSQRGWGPYMAPELFTPDGVHSYASDFWALGCMLYQLRRGTLPFGDASISFEKLVQQIRTAEPVHAPLPSADISLYPAHSVSADRRANGGAAGSAAGGGSGSGSLLSDTPSLSAELADLLMWLLEKAPTNRCDWTSLASHPYWMPHNPIPPKQLPEQPVYEKLAAGFEKARLQRLEAAALAEAGLDGESLLACGPGTSRGACAGARDTPLKGPKAMDYTPVRPEGGGNLGGGGTGGAVAGKAEAALESKADFPGTGTSSGAPTASLQSKQQGQQQGQHVTPERQRSGAQQAAYAVAQQHQQQQQQQRQYSNAHPPATPSTPAAPETPSARQVPTAAAAAAGPVASAAAGAGAGSAAAGAHGTTIQQSTTAATVLPDNLLLHTSDLQVKPIVGNKAIEQIDKHEADFSPDALTFAAVPLADVNRMDQSALEVHLTQVYKCLQKSAAAVQSAAATPNAAAALQDRIHVLGYLYSFASSAEVANVVLNTHFLNLILRLMKPGHTFVATRSSSRSSHNSTSSKSSSSMAQAMNAAASQSRTVAATVLAMMLRYATYLQPPTIRARDDHIVASIVQLLQDNARLEVRFKRRAVAALGETIFYITAQEEDDHSNNEEGGGGGTSAADKWVLAPSAVEMIVRCLKDEPDEIVKHYAAKTLENVLAQGGSDYRRLFVSVELGVRLLELSQQSSSDALRATCGMALSHLLHLVLTAYHSPLDPSNLSQQQQQQQQADGRTRSPSAAGLAGTITLNFDLFSSPSPVLGARFVAKVLEKGGLPGIMETLKDGPPKLQQAYLNILNFVFAAPILKRSGDVSPGDGGGGTPPPPAPSSPHSAAARAQRGLGLDGALEELDGATTQAVSVALRMSRNFFVKSHALVPVLVNLTEQGALSAVRAKSLLALQLVCKYSQHILATIADGRLPSLLVRLIAPINAEHEAHLTGAAGTDLQLSYFAKIALSMVHFIRTACIKAADKISLLLRQFVSSMEIATATAAVGGSPDPRLPPRSPAARGDLRTPPSPPPTTGKGGSSAGSKSKAKSTLSPGPVEAGVAGSGSIDASKLRLATAVLSAAASTASHPTLRRVILASDACLVNSLSHAIRELPAARASIDLLCAQAQSQQEQALAHAQAKSRTRGTAAATVAAAAEEATLRSNELVLMEEALAGTEQACLILMEMLAQVELQSANAQTLSHLTAGSNSSDVAAAANAPLLPTELSSTHFQDALATALVPAATVLLEHPSGDIRVVVVAALRRLLPGLLRLYMVIPGGGGGGAAAAAGAGEGGGGTLRAAAAMAARNAHAGVVVHGVHGVLLHTTALLRDHPPIPQYTVRLLLDLIDSTSADAATSASANAVLLADILAQLKLSGAFSALVRMLRSDKASGGARDGASGDAGSAEGDEDSRATPSTDPQLAVLLRTLAEWPDGVVALLEADVASAAAGALIASVYSSMQDALTAMSSSSGTTVGAGNGNGALLDAAQSAHVDLVIAQVDLLHVLLHFVIRELSSAEERDRRAESKSEDGIRGGARGGGGGSGVYYAEAERHRRLLAPLRAVSPALLLIFAYADRALKQYQRRYQEHQQQQGQQGAEALDLEEVLGSLTHLLDASSRCLGILFDLFPDTLTNQLLSKQSVTLDNKTATIGSTSQQQPPFMSPRAVMSALLFNLQVDGRVRTRILKITAGVCKMAAGMNISGKAKEMISTEPLLPALKFSADPRSIDDRRNSGRDHSDNINNSTMIKLASQIIELGERI